MRNMKLLLKTVNLKNNNLIN